MELLIKVKYKAIRINYNLYQKYVLWNYLQHFLGLAGIIIISNYVINIGIESL